MYACKYESTKTTHITIVIMNDELFIFMINLLRRHNSCNFIFYYHFVDESTFVLCYYAVVSI